jgi:SSS family solute:Na+ symporter
MNNFSIRCPPICFHAHLHPIVVRNHPEHFLTNEGERLTTLLANLSRLAILPLYLLATITIGWKSRRRGGAANDFVNASRALPLWIVISAFLSANCGALEIVGLSAVAAQYGVQAFHFYLIGAIPGMVVFGGAMIPVYMRSSIQSLPEYLERRYDARVRLINSWLILAKVVCVAGVGLYAMAKVLDVVFGWHFTSGALFIGIVVLIYVLLGGLRAAIYNEVLQLAVVVLGLTPLLFRTAGKLPDAAARIGSRWHLWTSLHPVSPDGSIDLFGVILGLGCVLSFSYWCTDFVQVQRALTARSAEAARLVPVLAGFGKLAFACLVVVPALAAPAFLHSSQSASFDETLPRLMVACYGPALLSLGLTALLASLMSGLAANVSAFSAVWTEEIYRTSIRRTASEKHYVLVARISIAAGIGLSMAVSYLCLNFKNLMEFVQMVFSIFGVPFFVVFLIGIFTRWATSTGALAGLLCGTTAASVFHLLVAARCLIFASSMNASFHAAVYAFCASLAGAILFSKKAQRISADQLELLVFAPGMGHETRQSSILWWTLACLLLALCAAFNYLWR